MRTTRKILLLPVLTVTSAAALLFASLGLSAANVPVFSDSEPATATADGTTKLTITGWNETAGSNNKKGKGGGGNGARARGGGKLRRRPYACAAAYRFAASSSIKRSVLSTWMLGSPSLNPSNLSPP